MAHRSSFTCSGSDPTAGTVGPYAFTDAEESITRDGITYQPIAIDRTAVEVSGSLDRVALTVKMQKGTALDEFFLMYPQTQVMNLIVFEGHDGDSTEELLDWPSVWNGRVVNCVDTDYELELTGEPLMTALRRPGLRRHYQRHCPHALYGPQCQAVKAAAGQTRAAASVSTGTITLATALSTVPARTKFAGGLVEWTAPGGVKHVRAIVSVSTNGLQVVTRGRIRSADLPANTNVTCYLGCGRTTTDCSNLHNNIVNYGGQPWIPNENPLSTRNNFY